MENIMQYIQNFQLRLIEYWFKTSGLKRIVVGLCLWFIGLVLLPINMVVIVDKNFIGFYMLRNYDTFKETDKVMNLEEHTIYAYGASTPIVLIDGKYYEDVPF
jgi:hypothetical protein